MDDELESEVEDVPEGDEEEDEGEEEEEEWGEEEDESKVLSSTRKLYTDEEWKDRETRRLARSTCCLQELWGIYDKLIDPLAAKKRAGLLDELDPDDKCQKDDENSDSGDDSLDKIISKNILERRVRGLRKKHSLFHLALDLIKEAASAPYIRISRPLNLDQTGGRHKLVQINRAQKPDIEMNDYQPKTIASSKMHTIVSNENFVSDLDESDSAWSQTVETGNTFIVPDQKSEEDDDDRRESRRVQFQSCDTQREMGSILSNNRQSHKEEETRATTEYPEEFEFLEYPLDEDGNPLGKTTGICHYCRNEILPFPTFSMLSQPFDLRQFFCCEAYQKMFDEVSTMEKEIMEQQVRDNWRIDIRPGGRFNPKAETFPGFSNPPENAVLPGGIRVKKKKPEKDQTSMEKKEKKKKAPAMPVDESTLARKTVEVTLDVIKKELGETMSRDSLKDDDNTKVITVSRSTDTSDLPWDPYVTIFGHPRFFQEGKFEDPLNLCYQYAIIVMTQAELYELIETAELSGTASM